MPENVISAAIRRFENGASSAAQDVLAVEEPLEILLDGRNISITMARSLTSMP
jgi:formate dehydrogenase assembly factor FdhD